MFVEPMKSHADYCDGERFCTCHPIVGLDTQPYLAMNGHTMVANIRAVNAEGRCVTDSWSA